MFLLAACGSNPDEDNLPGGGFMTGHGGTMKRSEAYDTHQGCVLPIATGVAAKDDLAYFIDSAADELDLRRHSPVT